ncbi:hypothetical protein R3P38DRAFT_2804426 [Favolaschia claudopus]|uniref:Uncharacterized protein n=1 Tax=Favolaschia claudopus TaxID=2862362 RepID=A0AAV9ZQ75_9AGAR
MCNPPAFLPFLSQVLDTLSSKTKIFEALRQMPASIKEYVQKRWRLTQRINRCADEVKEIEKCIQLLSMNERGRVILQGAREAEAIATTIIQGCVRRRVGDSSSEAIASINDSILQTDSNLYTAFKLSERHGELTWE